LVILAAQDFAGEPVARIHLPIRVPLGSMAVGSPTVRPCCAGEPAPEIRGYGQEYLEASSPRRQQIEEHLARENQRGAGAAQIAAHQTREEKLELSHEEMQQRHKAMAAQFGDQPERVVRAANEQREQLKEEPTGKPIEQAIHYAREKNLEREAVADERALLRDALKRSMGEATFGEVKAEFEKRVASREFIEASHRGPGRAFTTGEMIGYERDTINAMHAGQKQHVEREQPNGLAL
jgi:TrwC relaxase